MANITIQEFQGTPNAQGEPIYGSAGADVVTTISSPATHTIAATTRYAMVTSDEAVRAIVGSANTAGVSTVPILAEVTNDFYFEVGSAKAMKFA